MIFFPNGPAFKRFNHRNSGECLFQNEPLSDLRSRAVKLMGAVASFAQEYETRVADEFQQAVVVATRADERLGGLPDRIESVVCQLHRHVLRVNGTSSSGRDGPECLPLFLKSS